MKTHTATEIHYLPLACDTLTERPAARADTAARSWQPAEALDYQPEATWHPILTPYRPGYYVKVAIRKEREQQLARVAARAKADSVAAAEAPKSGLVFASVDAPGDAAPLRPVRETQTWILCGVLLLFVIIAFKFRGNMRYIRTLRRNLVAVRERQNVFDETVKEASFVLLLNVLWAVCTGLILFCWFRHTRHEPAPDMALGAGVCMAVALIYTALMPMLYWMSGRIFTDKESTRLWSVGFTSSQAFMALGLLPVSLLMLFYPQWTVQLAIAAGALLVLFRGLFIIKGLRIFIGRGMPLLLFLYYLCSVEVVPLVLLYVAALFAYVELI